MRTLRKYAAGRIAAADGSAERLQWLDPGARLRCCISLRQAMTRENRRALIWLIHGHSGSLRSISRWQDIGMRPKVRLQFPG